MNLQDYKTKLFKKFLGESRRDIEENLSQMEKKVLALDLELRKAGFNYHQRKEKIDYPRLKLIDSMRKKLIKGRLQEMEISQWCFENINATDEEIRNEALRLFDYYFN